MNDERDEAQEAEAAAEAEEIPAQEEPKLREIGEEKLEKILTEHHKWVVSEGKEGQKADLRRTNLKGRNLVAILDEADLREANLRVANLATANLYGADLSGADLKEANLSEANIIEADMKDADLTGANLISIERYARVKLWGANLDGVKLPEGLRVYEGLKTLEEASRNARKIFQVMLLACAYSLLTIFSTKDPALLTNSSSSPLPIIQTGVPIAGFFVWVMGSGKELIFYELWSYTH